MTRLMAALTLLIFAAACDEVTTTSAPSGPPLQVQNVQDELRTGNQTARAFSAVVARVEPVAEQECRRRTSNVNCDFRILVDDRPNQPPNAFQTLDDNNRPIIVFTLALLNEARNADEIAFVLGHEAAHHVEGHIARQKQNAAAGAVIFAGLATLTGGDQGAVESAQRIGAQVGARSYSKDFELEADALGTIITSRAGFDPIAGAQFFNRIPDPGDRFLGTHPPNAQRIETVRRTAAGL
ncbi:M48 family metallopeptidase [uncultured Tateyamaria sp.]|uniref:M48 family metallopeptidase n=1 Tax=uncultured Tateyamaria sp. TaxID=455651 RepID=UPI0026193EDB|nr:M48 family metallopeptidase [uncultured Tateyamaria sp.]